MRGDGEEQALYRETAAAQRLMTEIRAEIDAETDPDALVIDMVEGETSLLEAIDAALDAITACEVIEAGCKAAVDKIETRAKRAGDRKARLRAMVEHAMAMTEQKTIRRPTATLSLAHVKPIAIITDESQIPSRFWKSRDPVIDKAALNKAIQEESIPGASKTNAGVSLRVTR